VLVVRPGRGRETLQWIAGSVTSEPVSMASVDPIRTAIAGVGLGFTHIVPKGLDHILFVAGLALFSRGRRDLLALVTTFTAAHSVTLAMGLYGLVSVPPAVVEPLIALSVAYVGAENLFASSHARWRRLLSVLVFGLLHGLGFAGVLTDLAPSQASLLTALASFNAGVELGQLAVLVVTVAVLRLASRLRLHGDRTVARYGSAAVGVIGAVWTVERLFG
jgi:hydrogenase/urease accessory protein HupE